MQIVARLLLGDTLVDVLKQIDDPDIARELHTYLWKSVSEQDCDPNPADVGARDQARGDTPQTTTSADHPVAVTPIDDLERDAVIDRLIDDGAIRPPEGRTYDHDAAAYAYRVGVTSTDAMPRTTNFVLHRRLAESAKTYCLNFLSVRKTCRKTPFAIVWISFVPKYSRFGESPTTKRRQRQC